MFNTNRAIFILALLMFFYSCKNDVSEIAKITSGKIFPIESAMDEEIFYSDSAKVRVKVFAPVRNRFAGAKPYMEMPKGINVKFFDDSLQINSQLTSNYAISRESEHIMEARNNVVLTNVKGEKLNTEHLIWNQKEKKIYSEDFVKITTANEVILGDGFEADQDFKKYRIKKIRGNINLKNQSNAKNP